TRLLSENDAAITLAEIIQFRREVSLDNWRSFIGNWLPHSLLIHVHKLKRLSVWRVSIGFVKTSCSSPTTDHEKRPAGAARNHVLANPPPIGQRCRKKNCKTQQEHAAARLHRLIKCRRGINQHCTNHCCRNDGENVFGGVTESKLLHSPIVAADKVQSCHDHAELNQIDDEELKRRGVKCVVPKPPCNSVDGEPAHNIQKKVEPRRRPFVPEKTRPQTGAAGGAVALAP